MDSYHYQVFFHLSNWFMSVPVKKIIIEENSAKFFMNTWNSVKKTLILLNGKKIWLKKQIQYKNSSLFLMEFFSFENPVSKQNKVDFFVKSQCKGLYIVEKS